ncbi:chain-length determining protein [Nostoc sp. 'Peltigera membranacea cyanobiont' 213]|uniref:GumC family protein n=1 Tax=Nostoc sp. 'Peltigera membranacea cyanobiont' 213 TaxID=2014530 RepID=UPI000B957030|nr:polysaccharide biosynthesis tyrosine autokinase [Nostoc sp. 'Peltigera membranacea cyanobiont' 213]OYD98957.1 chain-length determining protein [Nostoc sp. 'Peltigera membranacea cyanobiont' 213]
MPSNQEDQNSLDLQQYSLIMKRRWLVITAVTASVFGLSALIAIKQKPIYEAEGKLLFSKTDRVSSLTSPSAQVGELSSLTQLSSPLDTEAEVIRSNPIVEKTITSLKLVDKRGIPLEIDDFLKKMKIKSVRGTDILAISYKSSNPKEAADVVNLLMRYYLENNIRINQTQATVAQKFLSKQLPEVEARVVKSEAALRRFKEENRVIALDQEATKGVDRLAGLSDQITQVQANLTDAETRSQLLERQLRLNSQQAVDMGNLSQSKSVQEVLKEYQETENELAVAHTRYTNEHPAIASLTAKEAALKKQLETRIIENADREKSVSSQNLGMGELKQTLLAQLVQSNVERSALANRVTLLQNAYALSQRRLSVLPQLQEKQQQLERQLQVARSTYEELLKRSQEVEVVVNQNVGNARVVSTALLPKKAVSPKIALYLALGGFVGILLGVGVALMLEAMDQSLKTLEQAQQLLGYPLLGTIPHLGQKTKNDGETLVELPVRDNPYSGASSAFEMLQTNLDFTISDKPLKVIAVVSSTPGEGRSFVAANLAVAKAHMGRRILLVDADMRHSCQQEIWKLSNPVGLSNVLVGQTEFRNTTQEVLVNLDLLTAGTIPPNPAALLDSQRMALLIEEAAKNYDCVIIDTPALSLFGDALMLGKMADGILLVVRPGVLDCAVAKSTKMMLEQARSRVLGMVMNGVTADSGFIHYNQKGYYDKNSSDAYGGKLRNGKGELKFPNIRIS